MVTEPDANTNAPQVICYISPTGNLLSKYAALELNHKTQPDFVAGGLQLQVWQSDWPLDYKNSPQTQKLATSNETVTWTTRMSVDNGSLSFEIVNGASTTWGAFGGQGYLKASTSTTLSTLAAYNPSVSVSNSGIGYASNRVTRLVLKEVRWYTTNGLYYTSDTDRYVYPHP